MLCPSDRNRLSRNANDCDKPYYQCNDCSGVFVPLPGEVLKSALTPDDPSSAFCCPNDGAELRAVESKGVTMHLCGTCCSAWLDGETQAKLLSKPLPRFLQSYGNSTVGSISGALVLENIVMILLV